MTRPNEVITKYPCAIKSEDKLEVTTSGIEGDVTFFCNIEGADEDGTACVVLSARQVRLLVDALKVTLREQP